MPLSFEQFRKHYQTKKFAPVYVFTGQEDFLRTRAISVMQNLIPKEHQFFNLTTFDCDKTNETSMKRIINCAIAAPMGHERRLIICKYFSTSNSEIQNRLLEYVKSPTKTTILIIQNDKFDGRLKFTKELFAASTVCDFAYLDEVTIKRWVAEYLKREGVNYEVGVPQALVERAGLSMTRLTNEINKLIICLDGEKPISVRAVEYMVPETTEKVSFGLYDAMVSPDKTRSIKLLYKLLEQGEEPIMLVGLIAFLLRKLLYVKDGYSKGNPIDQLMRDQKVYGPAAKYFASFCISMPREHFINFLGEITKLDIGLKSGAALPKVQVEMLLMKFLCRG